MEDDGFITRVREHKASLVRENRALSAQLQGIQRKLETNILEIEGYEAALGIYLEEMGIGAAEAEETPPVGLFEDVPQGSVAEMAYQVIKQSGGPMKVAEVAAALAQLGKLTVGQRKQNYRQVYSSVFRDGRFKKAGSGWFEIADREDGEDEMDIGERVSVVNVLEHLSPAPSSSE